MKPCFRKITIIRCKAQTNNGCENSLRSPQNHILTWSAVCHRIDLVQTSGTRLCKALVWRSWTWTSMNTRRTTPWRYPCTTTRRGWMSRSAIKAGDISHWLNTLMRLLLLIFQTKNWILIWYDASYFCQSLKNLWKFKVDDVFIHGRLQCLVSWSHALLWLLIRDVFD